MFKIKFIRRKLLMAFLIIIFTFMLLSVILAFIHFRLMKDYEEMTDNLILENDFMHSVPALIQAYGNIVNSPNSIERLQTYNDIKRDINESISELDKKIVSKESRLYYSLLKNIVKNIMVECDNGVNDINQNNLSAAFNRYEYVFSKNALIAETTVKLMGEELDYLKQHHDYIDKLHVNLLILGSGLFTLVILFCVFFALVFSNRLTKPLIDLSVLTKKIAGGDLNVRVDENIMKKDDEVGILSKSVNDMIGRINKEIESQKKISSELEASSTALTLRNTELEKFNKMAVDRELRMAELKLKITALEDKLQEYKKTGTEAEKNLNTKSE